MTARSARLACLALITALLMPATAVGCTIAVRAIGPIDLARSELRRPTQRQVSRSSWQLHPMWTSAPLQLEQSLVTRRVGVHHGVSFSRQRALSIDTTPPDRYGERLVDDMRAATPPCKLAGQSDWQPPQVRVRQTRQLVRITAASKRTPGDRVGCDVTVTDPFLGCPDVTAVIVRLALPLGKRTLFLERF